MRPINDPSFVTPDERLSEVASILAAGVLRLHARPAIPGDDLGRGISPDSGPAGLEGSKETVLSVYRWSMVAGTAVPTPVASSHPFSRNPNYRPILDTRWGIGRNRSRPRCRPQGFSPAEEGHGLLVGGARV